MASRAPRPRLIPGIIRARLEDCETGLTARIARAGPDLHCFTLQGPGSSLMPDVHILLQYVLLLLFCDNRFFVKGPRSDHAPPDHFNRLASPGRAVRGSGWGLRRPFVQRGVVERQHLLPDLRRVLGVADSVLHGGRRGEVDGEGERPGPDGRVHRKMEMFGRRGAR